MRAVLGFFSSLALGLMIAAILVVGATNVMTHPDARSHVRHAARLRFGGDRPRPGPRDRGFEPDLVGELPRRAARFVLHHAYRLRLIAWAALFTAVLIYF